MHIYSFYFIHLVGWLFWVDRLVPEAIHNHEAIKFLMSCLLTSRICYVRLFLHQTGFVYISFWFRASYFAFNVMNLTEAGVMHEAGYAYSI